LSLTEISEKALQLKINILVQLAVHFDTYPQKTPVHLHLPLSLSQQPEQKTPQTSRATKPSSVEGQILSESFDEEGEWEMLLEQQEKDASGRQHRPYNTTFTDSDKGSDEEGYPGLFRPSDEARDHTELTDEEMELVRRFKGGHHHHFHDASTMSKIESGREDDDAKPSKTYLNSNDNVPTGTYCAHYAAILCLKQLRVSF
jgi:hypothetical protein